MTIDPVDTASNWRLLWNLQLAVHQIIHAKDRNNPSYMTRKLQQNNRVHQNKVPTNRNFLGELRKNK